MSLVLSVILAVATQSPASPAPEAAPTPTAETSTPAPSLLGTWRFVGGAKERAAYEAALDAVCNEMNFLIRGIAKDRLHSRSPLPTTLSLTENGERLVFSRHGYTTSGSADKRPWKGKGIANEDVTIVQSLDGARFNEVVTAADGARETTLLLKGDRVIFTTILRSPSLPHSVTYSLTFAR